MVNDMAYVEWNPNPVGRKVGDCAIRAVAKVLGLGWEAAYITLTMNGIQMGNMQNANEVISATLRQHGFKRATIPNTCPDCYTIKDFCEDNPQGTFLVGTGQHVVGIEDGNYFDIWDSGDESPTYVWYQDKAPFFEG